MLPTLRINVVKHDEEIFKNTLSNDAIIYVPGSSQSIRFGCHGTELTPSLLSIDAFSFSSPHVAFQCPVDVKEVLEVKNDIIIGDNGALGIGSSNFDSTSTQLHVRGEILVDDGDVQTNFDGSSNIQLSRTIQVAEQTLEGDTLFTRGNGEGFSVPIDRINYVNKLARRAPPIGSLSWVMLGSSNASFTSEYLLADGSEVSESNFPELFQVYGDKYGIASTGNFRLPKMIGYEDTRDDLGITVNKSKLGRFEGGGDFVYTGFDNGLIKIRTSDMTIAQIDVGDSNVDAIDIFYDGGAGNAGNQGQGGGGGPSTRDNSRILRSIALSPDGQYIYAGSQSDNLTRKIDTSTMSNVESFSNFDGGALALAISSDGEFLYHPVSNPVVNTSLFQLLKVRTSDMVQEGPSFDKVTNNMGGIAISPDDKFVYTGHSTVYKIDVDTMIDVASLINPANAIIHGAVVSPDGTFFYFSSSNSIYKVRTSDMLIVGTFSSASGVIIYRIDIDQFGQYIYSGNSQNEVQKIATDVMEQVVGGLFTGHESNVITVGISPDGQFLYSGSFDRTLRKIDVEDMSEVSLITDVYLNPDLTTDAKVSAGIRVSGTKFFVRPLILAK